MLSAKDIQSQQFHVRFRGFDVEEVDEFLEQASAAVQELNDENARLKSRLEAAERKVEAYKRQEKDSMSAIVSAQQVAEEMKGKARQEADEILARARQEAKELEEGAGREISELERELDRLRAMKSQVREEVRRVLQGYLAGLDDDGVDTPAATAAGAAFNQESTASQADRVAAREEAAATPASGMARAAAGMAAVSAATDDNDHDELYQRLELPADWGAAPTQAEEPAADRATTSAAPTETASGEEDDKNLPDLDGDMVFTLEDPLDDQADDEHDGPNISLDDEEEAEDPPSRG